MQTGYLSLISESHIIIRKYIGDLLTGIKNLTASRHDISVIVQLTDSKADASEDMVFKLSCDGAGETFTAKKM